ESMIMVDFIDREMSVATQPTVCMHCQDPIAPCAQVCPVLAILISPDGVVHQAEPSRCIGCRNCVYACPFGVPKFDSAARLMKKCNLCYDRTSQGLQPWCAQACPTQALWYGDYEEFVNQREGRAVNVTTFGPETVRTRVYHVLPSAAPRLDVALLLAEAEAENGGARPAREEAWVL
ncbi:MAG TPA: 4Fe-4S dicluster domain-containing protein, partial [Thermomicrobiales bacterium]|nr:4Fe-4S dicluster domain-containing protein [Thermomicrobiales bacterium]